MTNQYTEQQKTLDDTLRILHQYFKCCIIRPTGFGKTYLLTELIRYFHKVLYLYPAEIIRDTIIDRHYEKMYDEITGHYTDDNGNIIDPETITTMKAMNKIENVTMMTYAKLVRLTPDEMDQNYDLIITDECHRLGGPKTQIAINDMLAANPTAKFVGATATPVRKDNFDVVSQFFNDHMVYSYTMLDAIRDNLLKKPYYCFCTYDLETDLKEAALTAGEDLSNPEVMEILQGKLIEMSTILNMPNTIQEVCNEYAADTNYMKFIIFFANHHHMKEKLNDVINWFQKAYPTHSVDVLKITSANKIESKNVEQLDTLKYRDNHIDIIACIDMLNMGYHVSNLTGILMYRATSSNTIFSQQLGRALSAGSENAAIVFDVVDNLHRKAIYQMTSSITNQKTQTSHSDSKTKAQTTMYHISKIDTNQIVTIDENGIEHATIYHFDENKNILDHHNNQTTFLYDTDTNQILDISSSKNKDCNFITKECLYAVGHMATYRELIAKAVAEPMSQRCKYALELHFCSWCSSHNVPYPISNEELELMYGLSKEDFYKYFVNILQTNHIDYPLQDAEALLAIGTDNNMDVPLTICAAQRNVSIRQILDCFGLETNS